MIDLNIDGSYKMNNKMKYFLIFFISHCFSRICTVKHNGEAPKNAQNPFGRLGPGQFWLGVRLVCLLVGAMVSSQQQKLRQQSLFMQGRAKPTIFFKLITMFLSKLNSYFIWSSIQLFLNHYYKWFLELRWCVWHNSTTSKLKRRWNLDTK